MIASVAIVNEPDEARERQWVAAARRGDTEAYRRVVELYQARIYTFLLRMVRQREEAEDLAQETFVRAWRNLDHYDERWAFRTWLFTIARNLALNVLRRPRAAIVSIHGDERDDRPPPAIAAAGPSPAERAVHSERQRRLVEALEQMAPRAAMIFTLFYQEEMSIADIARTTGMTQGAVKVALHRTRETLRQRLAESNGEP